MNCDYSNMVARLIDIVAPLMERPPCSQRDAIRRLINAPVRLGLPVRLGVLDMQRVRPSGQPDYSAITREIVEGYSDLLP